MSKAIETPEQRSDRGASMSLVVTGGVTDITGKPTIFANADWIYHHDAREKLTSSERQTFDLEFVKARAVDGVRPAVDLALAAMRKKLMGRLGKPRWGAAI